MMEQPIAYDIPSLPVLRHFISHYPLYHSSKYRLECWCGREFSTHFFSETEIERFIAFLTEHMACTPQEREEA